MLQVQYITSPSHPGSIPLSHSSPLRFMLLSSIDKRLKHGSNPPELPSELIDHIISYLHSDQTTLTRTTLVSRSWHLSSRFHLFHSIELCIREPLYDYTAAHDDSHLNPIYPTTTPTKNRRNVHHEAATQSIERYTKLYELITGPSQLADVIRSLSILRAHTLPRSFWPSIEPIFTSILRALRAVRTLHLHEVYFGHLSSDFMGALLMLCKSPTIVHIDLWNCHVPNFTDFRTLLSSSKQLKKLDLQFMRVVSGGVGETPRELVAVVDNIISTTSEGIVESRPASSDDGDSSSTTAPHSPRSLQTWSRQNSMAVAPHEVVELENLVLNRTMPILPWLLNPSSLVSVAKLRALHITDREYHPSLYPHIGELMHAARDTLECFELSGNASIPFHNETGLRFPPSLKRIKAEGIHVSETDSPVQCLVASFGGLTEPQSLETIEIALFIDVPRGGRLRMAHWEDLDHVFSAVPAFSALKKIKLLLDIARPVADMDIVRAFGEQFPRCGHLVELRTIHR